jgi:phospholipid/cholesterol/gamma-HCH transport system substrate-binding protein
MARRRSRGMTPVTAGVVALAVVVLILYFGFTKDVPFTHGFEVKGVFHSAVSIRPNSPVRIAGVNVGKVKSVDRFEDTDLSVVTMEIDDKGLPVHKDATMAIRPRIFLEGNFFIDVKPGSPSAPTLDSGDTVPVSQTATPVQLDEVLTALQGDTRSDLQSLLDGYGEALEGKPTASEDATQDPAVKGLTGAQALNKAFDDSPQALKSTAQVNEALLGTQPHDLSKLVANTAKVTRALNSREEQLKDLVTNLNVTLRATASESANLRAGIRLLPPTLATAFRALGDVDQALPPTRAFAREILPGVRETPATIDAAFPWVRQTKALLGPDELQGAARELRRTTPSTARLIDGTVKLLPQIDLLDRCALDVLLPTGDVHLTADGIDSGSSNIHEFFTVLTGLTGESQNFDGNGMFVRLQTGGGTETITNGTPKSNGATIKGVGVGTKDDPAGAKVGPLLAQLLRPGARTAPAFPGKRPDYRPDVPCYKNGALTSAELNGPAATGAPEATVGASGSSPSPLPPLTLPLTPPELPLPPLVGSLLPRKAAATAGSTARAARSTTGGAGR